MNFEADKCFGGGDVLRTEESIAEWGPCVYQSARYGDFCYNVQDLPAGDYMVDLYFAEIVFTNGPPGMRVFDIVLSGPPLNLVVSFLSTEYSLSTRIHFCTCSRSA